MYIYIHMYPGIPNTIIFSVFPVKTIVLLRGLLFYSLGLAGCIYLYIYIEYIHSKNPDPSLE